MKLVQWTCTIDIIKIKSSTWNHSDKIGNKVVYISSFMDKIIDFLLAGIIGRDIMIKMNEYSMNLSGIKFDQGK